MMNQNQLPRIVMIRFTLFFFVEYIILFDLLLHILIKVNSAEFSLLADFYNVGGLISDVISTSILWFTPKKSTRNSVLYIGSLIAVLTLYLVIGMTYGIHGSYLLQGYLFLTVISVTVVSIFRFTIGVSTEREK